MSDLSSLNHKDIEFYPQSDLTKMSTMKLKARGDLFIAKSEDGLRYLLLNLDDYVLLGWGANLLLKEESDVPYIKLDFQFNKKILETYQEEYDLPASCSLPVLSSAASRLGLKGWEVFTGVPASLGGAIVMNAGTGLGEISEVVKSFRVMSKTGELKEIKNEKNTFKYRANNVLRKGDVILSAVLIHRGHDPNVSSVIKDYLKYRNSTQPMNAKTCGCIFKNYHSEDLSCRAGQSIDILGLKGFTYKGLRISPMHANFIENSGEATYQDVIEFIAIIKTELKMYFGVDFEIEVKLND